MKALNVNKLTKIKLQISQRSTEKTIDKKIGEFKECLRDITYTGWLQLNLPYKQHPIE